MEDDSLKRLEDCELNLDFNLDLNDYRDNKNNNFFPNTLQGWLVVITSFFAIIASVLVVSNKLIDYNFAVRAQIYYNIPKSLFISDRYFGYYLNLLLPVINLIILSMPFIINKKYKNKEIDKLMLFSYSLLFAFLISTINIVNIYNILYRIFTNLDGIKFKIFFYCTFTFLIFINYVIINTNNSPDESSKNHTIENKINDQNVNYLIIIVVAIYVSLILIITAFYIHNMNIPSKDPGNIRSYEIIQEEEKYNVIIGYKDNKAITIEGNIRGSSTNKMLIFTSNEYKLQDISDKVIIYETFKNVTPFEGNGSIKGANGSDSKTVD